MRTAQLLVATIACMISFCTAGCTNPTAQVDKPTPTRDIPATSAVLTAEAPPNQPFTDYDFHLDKAEQETLARKINSLKMGMSKDEVNKIVQFKHDELSEAFVTKHDSVTRWYYIIARYRNGLSSQGADQYVNLFFNDKNQLDDVLSTFPLVNASMIKNSIAATRP